LYRVSLKELRQM